MGPAPVTIVIFGGSGDLAHRKLLPALYNLFVDGLLPEHFAIVGAGRKGWNDSQYRDFAEGGTREFSRRPLDDGKWRSFAEALFFATVDLNDARAFPTLGARLDTIEHERGVPGNRVYYLAVPPAQIRPIVDQLARSRFIGPPDAKAFARLIVEKPIGHDLESAVAIDEALAKAFDEQQIYRIDHYLGKETVQNLLVLRFANSFFEPLFNQRYIDHIQITVAEAEGVGTRAGYYEESGALRDMVQNHLLQLLSLVAMEPPHSLDADVIRNGKLQVLQALRPLTPEAVDAQVVRAQYGAGAAAGQPVPAYTREPGVSPQSSTETFVALQLFIDNWRWAGVPFFLRTGKRLPARASEIAVCLKQVPPILFNKDPAKRLEPNVLTIRIQPDEGFALGISSKVPGPNVEVQPVSMDFCYSEAFGKSSPEAYERLLLDVMSGDPTLFMRRDSVEMSWKWIAPVLDRWAEQKGAPIPVYDAGSWGPQAADRLIEATGRQWHPVKHRH